MKSAGLSSTPKFPRGRGDAKPDSTPSPSREGKKLGKYQILRPLGRGGMGEVYKGLDTVLGREVAIKFLPPSLAANSEAKERLFREAQSAARLSHPNVVAIHEVVEQDGATFIVMELVRGHSAQQWLHHKGAFAWIDATRILAYVCKGLGAAHSAGLVHRDIKPGNILVGRKGGIKLSDFGLAKFADASVASLTASGSVLGTPNYMSPEQCRTEPADERSDIYSLGATYFALLTGVAPYAGDVAVQIMFAHCSQPVPDPRKIVATVPDGCAAIIQRAMAKRRDARYRNVDEFLADLGKLFDDSASITSVLESEPEGDLTIKNELGSEDGSSTLSENASGDEALTFAEWMDVKNTSAHPPLRLSGSLVPTNRISKWNLRSKRVWIAFAVIASLSLATTWTLLKSRSSAGLQDESATRSSLALKEKQKSVPPVRGGDARVATATLKQGNLRSLADQKRSSFGAQADADRSGVAVLLRRLGKVFGAPIPLGGKGAAVAWSPNGQFVAAATSSGDGGVRVWDLKSSPAQMTKLWVGDRAAPVFLQSLSFSHDGEVLAAGSSGGIVRFWKPGDDAKSTWNLSTGLTVKNVNARFGIAKDTIAVMPAIGAAKIAKDSIKLFSVATKRELPVLEKLNGTLWTFALSTTEPILAAAGQDPTIQIWNAQTGTKLYELPAGLHVVTMCFTHDGKTLAVTGYCPAFDRTAPDRNQIQFWNAETGQSIGEPQATDEVVRCLDFSPDGALYATGQGNRISLWNRKDGKKLATLGAHESAVIGLTFSPGGSVLVSLGMEGSLRFWDVETLRPEPEKGRP